MTVEQVEKENDNNETELKYVIKDVNYAPLTHAEALKCALVNRGFDPIIVRNDKEMKKVKYRKMAMKTLVSECFEELKGAIFILLPVFLSIITPGPTSRRARPARAESRQ